MDINSVPILSSHQVPWGFSYVVDIPGQSKSIVMHELLVWVLKMRKATWG